jgi:hypothetical protein
MNYSPQLYLGRRFPRFRLTNTTPAFVQFHSGRRMAGELHVISLGGGLLLLPEPVDKGSVVEVIFETHKGPVLGTAEMLTPVSSMQQPFRFLALAEVGRRALQSAFQSRLYRNTDVEERIEELRAAVVNRVAKWTPSPWWRRFSATLVIVLLTLLGCLTYALYHLRY